MLSMVHALMASAVEVSHGGSQHWSLLSYPAQQYHLGKKLWAQGPAHKLNLRGLVWIPWAGYPRIVFTPWGNEGEGFVQGQYNNFLLGWRPPSQTLSMSCLFFLSHALSSGALKIVLICHSSISLMWERGIEWEKNDYDPEKNFFCSLFLLAWFRAHFFPHPLDVTDYLAYSLHVWPSHFLSLHVPL
jgi:hypothetical protein